LKDHFEAGEEEKGPEGSKEERKGCMERNWKEERKSPTKIVTALIIIITIGQPNTRQYYPARPDVYAAFSIPSECHRFEFHRSGEASNVD